MKEDAGKNTIPGLPQVLCYSFTTFIHVILFISSAAWRGQKKISLFGRISNSFEQIKDSFEQIKE